MMTRGLVHDAQQQIDLLLGPWAKRNGVDVRVSLPPSFSRNNATLKVTVSVINDDGIANTPEVLAYEKYANSLGLPSGACGKQVSIRGSLYTIVGLNSRATVNKIILRRRDGAMARIAPGNMAYWIKTSGLVDPNEPTPPPSSTDPITQNEEDFW